MRSVREYPPFPPQDPPMLYSDPRSERAIKTFISELHKLSEPNQMRIKQEMRENLMIYAFLDTLTEAKPLLDIQAKKSLDKSSKPLLKRKPRRRRAR